jgi:hypothetical protein
MLRRLRVVVRWSTRAVTVIATVLLAAEWALSYRSTGEVSVLVVRPPPSTPFLTFRASGVSLLSRDGVVDGSAGTWSASDDGELEGFSRLGRTKIYCLAERYGEPQGLQRPVGLFHFERQALPTRSGWNVRVPHWAPVLLCAALSAFMLVPAVRRRLRRRRGLSSACGYDLRYSRERCPECGTAATEVSHTPPEPA